MARSRDPNQFVNLQFPVLGLDTSTGLQTPKPGTTLSCRNVRPIDQRSGRQRGGQRPGISRFSDIQITTAAGGFQELNHVVVNADYGIQPFGTGKTTIALPNHQFYTVNDAGTITGIETEHWVTTPTFDEDGNMYVCLGAGGSPFNDIMEVVKYDKDNKILWRSTLNSTAATAKSPTGIVVDKGIVYVLAYIGTSGTNYFLYRLDALNGDAYGTNPWVNLSIIYSNPGINIHSHLAIGTDYLFCVGYDTNTTTLKITTVAKATGTEGTPADVVVAVTSSSRVVADASDNCYLTFGSAGTTLNRLRKYNTALTAQWTLTGSTEIRDCTYDRLNSRLLCVGDTIGGSAYSVAIVDATLGTVSSGAQPSSVTLWKSIATDGRGSYRIATTNTLAKINSSFTVAWSTVIAGATVNGNGLASCSGEQTVYTAKPAGRVHRLLSIAGGTVQCFDKHGVIPVTSGSSAMSALRPVVFTAQNGAMLYMTDGTNVKKYNPVTNTVSAWTASSGTFPSSGANYPKLIETWRARTILSGLNDDPQNYFASRTYDGTDWNYSPTPTAATQAFAGNNPDGAGRVPDIINAMIPYSDHLLIFGGDHTLYRLTGDPFSDGRVEQISRITGMAWGRPWTIDALGAIYFYGSRGGVYRMTPGGAPESISKTIDRDLQNVDLTKHIVRMAWNELEGVLHVYLTPLLNTSTTIHYEWQQATGGWFAVDFASTDFNPKAIHLFDGDDPNDRVLLLGSWDGYVRFSDIEAKDDDSGRKAINSFVMIGPLQLPNQLGVLLTELQGFLASESDPVTWSVHTGESVESALDAPAVLSGTFKGGRNHSQPVNIFGHALFLKLSSNKIGSAWQMEQILAVVRSQGQERQRRF